MGADAPGESAAAGGLSLKVLIVAPFERGREFGGSLRATAVAERLEERDVSVEWLRFAPRPQRLREKLPGALRLRPNIVGYHADRPAGLPGGYAAAFAAHSYMAPYLDAVPGRPLRAVDFHNLEWRHLNSLGRLHSRLRRVHLLPQSGLMRRYEIGICRAIDFGTFVSESERVWARRQAPALRTLLLPSVLPRATAEIAERAWRSRSADRHDGYLLYLGQLTFPPNTLAFLRFLREVWPRIRRRRPELRLVVVGALPQDLKREIDRRGDARAAGFVEDLVPLLSDAAAAVLPIESGAGSSLRALLLALAGVPMIGSPMAFRGLGFSAGRVVFSSDDWIAAVERTLTEREQPGAVRASALGVQTDPRPWDELVSRLGSAWPGFTRRTA